MATMTGEDCLRLGDSRGRRCSADSGGGELHVLAVDDSIVDRKVIERLLRISSCRVTAVESGRRALQYLGLDGGETATSTNTFHEMKVNLIMTDYSMPGMNGYELLKKIKESSALREIPVVIMSSENVMTRIDRCLEEGAEDFLLKPVKLSDVKRLKEYIKKGQEDENEAIQTHKRKLEEEEDEATPPLSPSSHLSSPSLAPSPSSPSATNHPSKRAKQLHDGV